MTKRFVLPLLVVMALFAAACGDDDDGGTASTTAPAVDNGGATDTGVTGDSIKVGQVVTLTGNAATAMIDFDKGFEAYVEMINEEGGVNGREIEVLDARDDGGEPARNQSEITTLFEQDEVFTVVGSFPEFGAADYLETNQLPLIGTNFNEPVWELTDYALGIGGNWKDPTPDDDPEESLLDLGIFYAFAKNEATKIGVISYTHPGSRAGSEDVCKAAPTYGFECVYEDYSLDFGFTDLGASVDQIRSSGVEMLWGAVDAGGGLTIARSLKRAGLDIPMIWAVEPNAEQAAASKDLIGSIFGSQEAPPFDSDLPAMVQLREEVEARKPGTKMSFAVINGWVAGMLLHEGLEGAGPELTRAGMYEAIRELTAFDGDGLQNPVDFTTSEEAKIRAGIPRDPEGCENFLLRGDAEAGAMVQVGMKPKLCLNTVIDADTLQAIIDEDDTSIEVDEQ